MVALNIQDYRHDYYKGFIIFYLHFINHYPIFISLNSISGNIILCYLFIIIDILFIDPV